MQKTAEWVIDDNKLAIFDPSGNTIYPAAMDIYPYLCGSAEDVLGYKFEHKPKYKSWYVKCSRTPLDLTLHLYAHLHEKEIELKTNLHLVNRDVELVYEETNLPEVDHIIIDNVWYPFRRNALEDLKLYFEEIDLDSLGNMNLRSFLRIKYDSQKSEWIIDHSDDRVDARVITYSASSPGENFKGSLYPFQQSGFSWLSWISDQNLGCILADEMGLGKTVQVIALIASSMNNVQPSLIIAPATLLENWKREFVKFSPDLRSLIHIGSNRTGIPADLTEFDTVITSYATAIRDVQLFRMIDWNYLILDEAQAIKNPETKRAEKLKLLTSRVSIAMTGTPIQNSLTDLWSIMDFVLPGYLGTREEFESRYSDTIHDAFKVEPIVSPVLLRRRIDEVANQLPEKVVIPQVLTMSESEAKEYESIRSTIKEEYGDQATFPMLMKLRQYCCHPWVIDKTLEGDLWSTKFRRLFEILEEIFSSQGKAIIFTSFHDMADLIYDSVSKLYYVYCAKIDGRTPRDVRQEIIDDFSSFEGAGLLIMNPRAAGVGLNVTAASFVIHYNMEWNPAVEDQATARAYRIGQEQTVRVYRLFYSNTIEEVMNERLERKRKLASGAVVGVEGEPEDISDIIAALRISPVSESEM